MIQTAGFSRGMGAPSREDAIRRGLAVANFDPSHLDELPKGLFYFRDTRSDYRSIVEQIAQLRSRFHVPVTVNLTLTEATFPLLAGRIHRIEDKSDQSFITVPIRTFRETEIPSSMALIDLEGLPHEDLSALDLDVGFMEGRTFRYQPYTAWTQELGVRAKTREEMSMDQEGSNPYRRK